MRLLITGGAGFIGSNLLHLIADEPAIEHLVCLDALTYAGRPENLAGLESRPHYHFEHIDLRHADAVAAAVRRHAITHVAHLAAESHVDRSITGPADFIHSNITGTFHLIEACRAAWGDHADPDRHRFLHVSTDEVFGSLGPDDPPFSIDTPYRPRSPYAASKAAADHLVRAAANTYGLPALVTNCSNNYGPRQYPEKLIPVVIQAALARKPIPVYGRGANVRDWLYVDDHCRGLWQALTTGQPGATYLFGGGWECSNLELVTRLCGLIDQLAPHPDGPAADLITFVTDRPGHDFRYSIDAAPTTAALGWTPRHNPETALRKTVEWYCGGTP